MSKLLIIVLAVASVYCGNSAEELDLREDSEDLNLSLEPFTDEEPTLSVEGEDERIDRLEKAVAALKKNLWGKVNAKCPNAYTWNSGLHLCYKIHNRDEVPWHVASLICRLETEGGRLAIFNTDAERIAVTSEIQALDGEDKFNYFVGARRGRDEKIWWTDGSATDKMTWCEDQPSGTECGNLWGRMGHCMDDTYCHFPQRFVCEKPVD